MAAAAALLLLQIGQLQLDAWPGACASQCSAACWVVGGAHSAVDPDASVLCQPGQNERDPIGESN